MLVRLSFTDLLCRSSISKGLLSWMPPLRNPWGSSSICRWFWCISISFFGFSLLGCSKAWSHGNTWKSCFVNQSFLVQKWGQWMITEEIYQIIPLVYILLAVWNSPRLFFKIELSFNKSGMLPLVCTYNSEWNITTWVFKSAVSLCIFLHFICNANLGKGSYFLLIIWIPTSDRSWCQCFSANSCIY
jgi:hypothetical protein